VSPLDGRYARQSSTYKLGEYFSEYALNKYRVRVEVEYFLALGSILPALKGVDLKPEACRNIYEDFSVEDAVKVKNTEKITNHDVKAIEYYVKEKLEQIGLKDYQEFVHFGLTSEDINCTANPLSLKEFVQHVYIPALENDIIKPLKELAKSTYDVPMLARTHGQPATPTMLGKELYVFVDRLEKQLEMLKAIPYSGKFGGATGGMNAQCIAYGDIDWITFANAFYKKSFDLDRQQFTTQIEHYDDTGAVFDTCKRINVILLDFSKDMWQYISMEYFKQKVIKNEVGSSAMPHKVNPIDFENAEGNFGLANCVFEHLAVKLPVSRLQRDLTDSTVRRNYGVPFGHTMVGFASLKRGVGKLLLNEKKIDDDLEKNWAVVAEAIQTVLRREQYEKPYEALKAFTRGAEINKDLMMRFVDSLDVKPEVRKELESITPQSFARAGQIPTV
jgi:adenylosuccinate lyase